MESQSGKRQVGLKPCEMPHHVRVSWLYLNQCAEVTTHLPPPAQTAERRLRDGCLETDRHCPPNQHWNSATPHPGTNCGLVVAGLWSTTLRSHDAHFCNHLAGCKKARARPSTSQARLACDASSSRRRNARSTSAASALQIAQRIPGSHASVETAVACQTGQPPKGCCSSLSQPLTDNSAPQQ